jgi:hypothetical protein
MNIKEFLLFYLFGLMYRFIYLCIVDIMNGWSLATQHIAQEYLASNGSPTDSTGGKSKQTVLTKKICEEREKREIVVMTESIIK